MESDRNLQATGKDSLSDEQRVKVLSPSMLVFKRFVRNKLAITGLIILVVMFSFSFIGGVVSPYTQSQVFKKYEDTSKEYAGATVNREIRYVAADGSSFGSGAYASFIKAVNGGVSAFSAGGVDYTVEALGGNSVYQVMELSQIATVTGKKNLYKFSQTGDVAITDGIEAAFTAAMQAGETSFEADGARYHIVQKDKLTTAICVDQQAAVASVNIFDAFSAADETIIDSYAFHAAAERAIATGEASFEADGTMYTVASDEDSTIIYKDGTAFAGVSDLIVNAISPDVFITMSFKEAFQKAIDEGVREFTIADEAGNETKYTFALVASQYTISTQMSTLLNDTYAAPSIHHILGTDNNGMDVLTRLMYGGRVSLLVGFVVVFIEMFIGIIFGGVSGYFGSWVDTLLMRFVDLFNCIPFWPIMIIAGSVMDTLDIDSYTRIFLLMFIMGLQGWTGIARVVRGQILSLREQDFMVATEATGIRVSRRIFRHLVPNVMPLLIVQATMSLGGIIITEATLSFLGLGIKYPLASWGSIINAATDIYVMKAYWFIWIPAGILILLTVLGFNFVGDGLRDAFDPKMKRQVTSMLGKKKSTAKKANYISAKESHRISRENRRITNEIEKRRNRRHVPASEYETKMRDPKNIVEFDDLHTYFFTDIGTVKAVGGVSFDVPMGKTVGVVGESGCGKSVTSLSLMQLVQRPQGQIVKGAIRLNMGAYAVDVAKMPTQAMEKVRGNIVSMIFQEPMTSLNPVFRIGAQVDEVIKLHNQSMPDEDVRARTIEALETVGIANAQGVYRMYPHELSGGMRQRVMIAMALACNPRLIIADEPTTALDVTIQAQILDLLRNLKDKINSSIMLITHDLGVIAEMADYVVVMYAGRIVEKGTAEEVFLHPAHPYTIGLMASKPVVGKDVDRLYSIPGSVPNPVNMPDFCYFKDRCEQCCELCASKYPSEVHLSDTHVVSCYLYGREASK